MIGRAAAAARLAQLGHRWRVPLYRNGYALILSSAMTSGLGLLYWLIAARSYSTAAVGTSAALIAAMSLLGDLSHLNLKGALNRFLPRAGEGAIRLTLSAYGLALAIGALTSLVFIAGIDVWSPDLGVLRERPEIGALFVLGTMGWAIFVLQDSVLTGIRRAVWVPAENAVFAVAKIALLVVLASTLPTLGVFVSWSVPMLALIVPINLLLFYVLIPAHVRQTRHRREVVVPRVIARYAAADYLAYMIRTGTQGVLPLVVLNVLGPEENAYYFLAWMIAYALYLVSSNMGSSMMTEAALEPERLWVLCRQTVVEAARLVVPSVAVIVIGAPLLLRLVGEEYAEEATDTLRLLALSAVPYIIVVTFVKARSVQRRMRSVVVTETILCVVVLSLGVPLLGTLGITGLALAWLVAQSVIAVGILALYGLARSRGGARGAILVLASRAARGLRALRGRRETDRAAQEVLEIVGTSSSALSGWTIGRHLPPLNDVTVTTVGPRGSGPVAVLKRARTPSQDRAVLREARVLDALHRRPDLGGWAAATVPLALARGRARGRAYAIQTLCPGASAAAAVRGPARAGVLAAAAASIAPVHRATARTVVVDDRRVACWVDEPVEILRPAVRRRSRLPDGELLLERLGGQLRAALLGAPVAEGWVHGDLAPENVLVDAADGAVTGIVDWEQARARDLPHLDLLHLLLASRALAQGRELGHVVADVLARAAWDEAERPILRRLEQLDTLWADDAGALVLLAWLRHVSGNVAKSPRYGRSRIWVSRNVDPVLAAVGGRA